MNIAILKLANSRKIGVRRWIVPGYSNGVTVTAPSRNVNGWYAASLPDRPNFGVATFDLLRRRAEAKMWARRLIWIPQIDKDTCLIVPVIAESIAGESLALQITTPKQMEALASALELRAASCYSGNKSFRKKLNARGNAGRDSLYMFMRHWAASWIQKNLGGDACRKLPTGYNVGRPDHAVKIGA